MSDSKKIIEAITTITTQFNDILFAIKRMETKNDSMDKAIGFMTRKIDALNSLNGVQSTKKKDKPVDDAQDDSGDESGEEKIQLPKVKQDMPAHFSTILAFFKHIYINEHDVLIEKKILDEEDEEKLLGNKDNKKKLAAKKGIEKQKAEATIIWKSLDKKHQEKTRSLKAEYMAKYNMHKSKELKEEKETVNVKKLNKKVETKSDSESESESESTKKITKKKEESDSEVGSNNDSASDIEEPTQESESD